MIALRLAQMTGELDADAVMAQLPLAGAVEWLAFLELQQEEAKGEKPAEQQSFNWKDFQAKMGALAQVREAKQRRASAHSR